MATSILTDEKLWRSLLTGDRVAFSALFERHYASLVGYGTSLSADRDKVQDCVQDVFVELWLYHQNLNPQATAKSYLISCVRRRIARLHERDHVFRQSTRLDDPDSTVEFSLNFTVEDRLIANEEAALQVRQLNRKLNALTARQREALYLRYHQGLSIDEIAEVLDINNQSVSNLLHRSIRQLRRDWTGNMPLLLFLLAVIS